MAKDYLEEERRRGLRIGATSVSLSQIHTIPGYECLKFIQSQCAPSFFLLEKTGMTKYWRDWCNPHVRRKALIGKGKSAEMGRLTKNLTQERMVSDIRTIARDA
jgi:hypothetical protein